MKKTTDVNSAQSGQTQRFWMEQCFDSGQNEYSFPIVFVRIPVFESVKIQGDIQKTTGVDQICPENIRPVH
jgi:hypothetical protein